MIGIDMIKSSRMKQLMERFKTKGLRRFLSLDEIEIINNYTSAAGFWAAKEAFSKALGTGISQKCSFHDIQIYKTPMGAPKIMLSKKIIEEFDIKNVALSITHDGDYAIAIVNIELNTSTTTDKVKQF